MGLGEAMGPTVLAVRRMARGQPRAIRPPMARMAPRVSRVKAAAAAVAGAAAMPGVILGAAAAAAAAAAVVVAEPALQEWAEAQVLPSCSRTQTLVLSLVRCLPETVAMVAMVVTAQVAVTVVPVVSAVNMKMILETAAQVARAELAERVVMVAVVAVVHPSVSYVLLRQLCLWTA